MYTVHAQKIQPKIYITENENLVEKKSTAMF